jgi:hypothetical protein
MDIAVNNPAPNSSLYLVFTVVFSDRINGISTNRFLISDSVKGSNAIHLLGIETISVNSLDDNRSIVVFKATVINNSNFSAYNAAMVLQGRNPDFTVSVPLNDIGPGQYMIKEFNLTLLSEHFPRFIVSFTYTDANNAEHISNIEYITVYSNDSKDVETQIQYIFRMAAMVLLLLFIAAGIIVFTNIYRAKKRRFQ